MSMLRHRFSNERWGGGWPSRTTFLSYLMYQSIPAVNVPLADPQGIF